MNQTQIYKMSFTTGGLLYHESVKAAELYVELQDWPTVRKSIVETNLFQARTENTLKRVCSEILSRLKLFPPELIQIIHDGSRQDQNQILWFAVCKRYKFIHDFAIEVIREKFLQMDYPFSEQDYDIFFDTKAEWHEELSVLKDSTKKKLRQVVLKMLREVEIISENMIVPAFISQKTAKALLKDPFGSYMVLPVSEKDLREWAK
jgi:hypothetical protein